MIRLDTGTPGAGKTLINVRDIVQLEKTNQKNIILNPKIYETNLKVIQDKKISDDFLYCVRKVGQGVDLKEQVFHFDNTYFDFLKSSERIEEYFSRSIFYNEIIERVNNEHNLKLNKVRPVRTIYTNIAGLEIDTIRPIPADADWRKLPDGSFVVYDEIQNIPVFSSESRAVDPIVKDLTIHRHRGFDIVGITQFPDLVHKTFRAVTGHHRHLVNSFGLKRSTQYEWSTVKIDPNAFKNKATAEVKSTFVFPSDLYKYYRSSTAHTHKRRLPWRFIMILTSVLIACIALFTCSFSKENNVVRQIATGTPHQTKTTEKTDAKNTAVQGQSSTVQSNLDIECRKAANVEKPECVAWFENLTVNRGSVTGANPQTVQVSYNPNKPFDDSGIQPSINYEVTAKPVFAGCMKKGNKYVAYTQQGTILNHVSSSDCKRLIENGDRPFNYFQQPQLQAQQQPIQEKLTSLDAEFLAKYQQAKAEGLI
ncbi:MULTISPECIES: zonular occludens toxin domain-containing protein [Acinetobacter]|uniref:zonular occludens toxin domain-containing protein n=1 Tax=Acinetobacter TaxID=469 RepID=UPI0004507927|nr:MULTISPECIES: zonular occludens toxin domain-containing protein [Acinetobacter]EXB78228.1 zonular occludens toxin family protein [Acinetobacter sp. 272263]MCX0338229.1 zonular occludens toxin domain-containing protein [Acinetobacter radioresistens]MCX0347115.1 zonular occludens toxin domain-containing protein [Acinetobacter radioresistens]